MQGQQVSDPSPETMASDARMLDDILEKEEIEHLRPDAFKGMRWRLKQGFYLSVKQHQWIAGFYEKHFDVPHYENLASSGKLLRGREVATPECLKRENLPLKPPGRI
jgi:hypothetical protein